MNVGDFLAQTMAGPPGPTVTPPQVQGPPAVQGPPPPERTNPFLGLGKRIIGGVGSALDQLTATPENRLATQVMALNLLKGGSGNGLTDFANAGQAGLATLIQARQQAAEQARADQALDLQKQQLELQKRQLARTETQDRARNYADAATYKFNVKKWEEDVQLRREEMANRLQTARAGGSVGGAEYQAANQIAKAIKGRYPELSDDAAVLMGWQVYLTRGKSLMETSSFNVAQTAFDYLMSREKNEGLIEGWAQDPAKRTKAYNDSIGYATEMARLMGANPGERKDALQKLDELVNKELGSQVARTPITDDPGSPPSPPESPARSGSPTTGSSEPPPVTARGSGFAGLSTTQRPAAWVGRAAIGKDPKTGESTLLRILEATPAGFRVKRDSDGVEEIISYEEMNSAGYWSRFQK